MPHQETAGHILDTLDKNKALARLWAKDPSLWKSDPLHQAIIERSLGWLNMPEIMLGKIGELASFAQEIRKEKFSHALLLGMGGSSLAPEVFRRIFPPKPGFPALHVLDSTDPQAVLEADRACDPRHTLYIVASKSGTTTEPLRLFDYFYARAASKLGSTSGKRFIAITDPGSPLENLASGKSFRRIFLNFEDIGGRYSALSYFGLIPAALLGMDLKTLLERSAKMAHACRKEKARENPGASLAAEILALASQGKDKLTFLLSPKLASLGLWLEQLIAESTGQEGRGVIPISGEPLQEPGYYKEDRVFVHIRLVPSKNVLDKAAKTLAKSHPVFHIELKDPLDLGAEFYRWEIATALMGHLLSINVFDQPNVEEAKLQTKNLINYLAQNGNLPVLGSHAREGDFTLSLSKAAHSQKPNNFKEALANLLRSARPKDYIALLPYLSPSGIYEKELNRFKEILLKATGSAVQFGYGPRYLHSTGQLHKGGPDSGIFLILTQDSVPNVKIPGFSYTFGQLIQAQALGDFQALNAGNRRAAYIHFSGDAKKALLKLTQTLGSAPEP